jgi:hypothetical protein
VVVVSFVMFERQRREEQDFAELEKGESKGE